MQAYAGGIRIVAGCGGRSRSRKETRKVGVSGWSVPSNHLEVFEIQYFVPTPLPLPPRPLPLPPRRTSSDPHIGQHPKPTTSKTSNGHGRYRKNNR
jgi:hypothetical protein